MKKLIMIASLVFMTSCGNKTSENGEKGILDSMLTSNNAPKCDDSIVIETVKKIIVDSHIENVEFLNSNAEKEDEEMRDKQKLDTNISNIITNEINNELKSCRCEATFKNEELDYSGIQFGNVTIQNGDKIYFDVKTDSNGELNVEVYK